MNEILGWLLDIYADQGEGLILWIIDRNGPRQRLIQDFPITFYAAGPFPRLRALWEFVKSHAVETTLRREQRRDLFSGQRDCLAIQVANPAQQPQLFRDVSGRFPALDYYDSDIPIPIRYAAAHELFPLAYGRFLVDGANRIHEVEALDSPWDLDAPEPVLNILTITPDVDPQHASPRSVRIDSPAGQVQVCVIFCQLPNGQTYPCPNTTDYRCKVFKNGLGMCTAKQ